MKDGLSGVESVVNDHPISLRIETSIRGKFLCNQEEVSDEIFIRIRHAVNVGNVFFGDDKGMDRRLGIDVLKGNRFCVLMDDPGGNFFLYDFTEETAWFRIHFFSLSEFSKKLLKKQVRAPV